MTLYVGFAHVTTTIINIIAVYTTHKLPEEGLWDSAQSHTSMARKPCIQKAATQCDITDAWNDVLFPVQQSSTKKQKS